LGTTRKAIPFLSAIDCIKIFSLDDLAGGQSGDCLVAETLQALGAWRQLGFRNKTAVPPGFDKIIAPPRALGWKPWINHNYGGCR
jgi:hypothetical protein